MRKIIGVTVGTPISPKLIKEKLKPVTSVNGIEADENGNVEVEIPAGADGKTAYQYAQDGGYLGTEEDFAQKLAQEVPRGSGIHIGTEAPTDGSSVWIDTDEEEIEASDDVEQIEMLIAEDMLPAVYDVSGILTDENGNVILRY